MFFKAQRTELEAARNEARNLFDETGIKPKVLSVGNAKAFGHEIGYALKLISQEKEILFFAILQWLVISLAYTLWTQILDWIPDSVWEEVRKSSDKNDNGAFTLMNLVLLGWSFFVVAIASYPISLFNAAMTASHYLRSSNQTSTIAKCLNLAFKHLGRLWIFTTIDAWITVNAILDRLPKKHGHRSAFDELLYYAWKIGTVGVLPALVAGKTYVEAARNSVAIIRNAPARAIGIRMGYSLICWIIGIAAYFGSFYYFTAYGVHHETTNKIYNFYFLMAVPIIIAIGVTGVLVRPIFLIAISKLYTDLLPLDTEVTTLHVGKKFDILAAVFAVMLCILAALYFFGDQLGIRAWIETLAVKDIQTYRQSFPG